MQAIEFSEIGKAHIVEVQKPEPKVGQVRVRVIKAGICHSVIGGLGEAVAGELLRAGLAPAFRQICLPDAFLDAGALPSLHDLYGISSEAIVKTVQGWCT